MTRVPYFVPITLLLVAVIGCTEPTTTDDSSGNVADEQVNEPVEDASTDADESQPSQQPNGSQTEPETAGSTNAAPVESSVLKEAMIEVTLNLLKAELPDIEREAVLGQVEDAIAQIREDALDFLIVSAETGENLKAGTPTEDAVERIADAEAFLNEFEMELSGLVAFLLQEHQTDSLTVAETELLAQLIVVDVIKAEIALSGAGDVFEPPFRVKAGDAYIYYVEIRRS